MNDQHTPQTTTAAPNPGPCASETCTCGPNCQCGPNYTCAPVCDCANQKG